MCPPSSSLPTPIKILFTLSTLLLLTGIILLLTTAFITQEDIFFQHHHQLSLIEPKDPSFRLLEVVVPLHYNVSLKIHQFDDDAFDGVVDVVVGVEDSFFNNTGEGSHVGVLRIHALVEDVGDVRIVESGSVMVDQFEYLRDIQQISVRVIAGNAVSQQFVLHVEYKGTIQDNYVGLYRTFYGSGSQKKSILSTQFESTYARMLFPCFDEPGFKATWTLSLDIPKGYTALGNMPVESTNDMGDREMVVFQNTPNMSSYLIALVIGELDFIEGSTSRGTAVRVYATPGHTDVSLFGLQSAIRSLDYFESILVDYPLGKIDLVGIPGYAYAGAMENWGLVTFREDLLLVDDPLNPSIQSQGDVALVVSHELAHQWFGNLVTMKWWSDIWLNEGFANYFELRAVDNDYPEWDMLDESLIRNQETAFSTDSLSHTHSIKSEANSNEDIESLFDSISYSKGAALLDMIDDWLGDQVLFGILKNYLNKYQYSNAETYDLWHEIQLETGIENVENKLSTWTDNKGFPIITVEVSDSVIILHQDRFFVSPDYSDDENEDWWIPITLQYSNGLLMKDSFDSKEYRISRDNTFDWIKLNYGHHGLYRVNYAPDMWDKLFSIYSSFSPLDRAGLLDDAMVMARTNRLSYSKALDYVNNLISEESSTVWASASVELSTLFSYLYDKACFAEYKEFIARLVKPQYERLGWTENTNDTRKELIFRSNIISAALSVEIEDAVSVAQDYFYMHFDVSDPFRIPNDFIEPVLASNIRNSQYAFTTVLERFYQEENESLRRSYLTALSATEKIYLLEELLEIILDPRVIRPEERRFLLIRISENVYGTPLAWDFLREHWDNVNLGIGNGSILFRVTKNFHTQQKYLDVTAFLQQKMSSDSELSEKILESISNNIMWEENLATSVCSYLVRK